MAKIECNCSVEPEDTAECYSEEVRTAKRRHICGECREDIQPSQQYEIAKGLTDGHWWSAKTCFSCVAIRNRYFPDGFIFGEMKFRLEGCLGFDYTKVPDTSNKEDGPDLYPQACE